MSTRLLRVWWRRKEFTGKKQTAGQPHLFVLPKELGLLPPGVFFVSLKEPHAKLLEVGSDLRVRYPLIPDSENPSKGIDKISEGRWVRAQAALPVAT